ncbi:MAG: CBS domain-containing protein [Candidatus Gastranaerophilales bacterium]|nr:CBS domain-containing protein [Candidatus Gastranaerophilales bacterium]
MQFYVKDIMTTDLITVKENQKLKEIIDIFGQNSILGAPVIDEEGCLTGIISISDILKTRQVQSFYHAPFIRDLEFKFLHDNKDSLEQKVFSIMTQNLFTVEPDYTIEKMAKIMHDNKVHRLLVVEYKKLVGIVSTFDLLKLLASIDENPTIT